MAAAGRWLATSRPYRCGTSMRRSAGRRCSRSATGRSPRLPGRAGRQRRARPRVRRRRGAAVGAPRRRDPRDVAAPTSKSVWATGASATGWRSRMPLDTSSTAPFVAAFSDPEPLRDYADGPRRFVPGFADLHRMTGILLAERAPPDAQVLVLGAGGGLELKALAEAQPGWPFVGVDPAAAMLRQAERTLGAAHRPCPSCMQGYIDDAPAGPFDAATCLLTLHFLAADERRRTAAQSIAGSSPARRLSPPIRAFRKPPASARDGCLAMPPLRSPPAPIRTWPKKRAAPPRPISACSTRNRTRSPARGRLPGCRAVLRRLYLARMGRLRLNSRRRKTTPRCRDATCSIVLCRYRCVSCTPAEQCKENDDEQEHDLPVVQP